jgi:hypothetical protein
MSTSQSSRNVQATGSVGNWHDEPTETTALLEARQGQKVLHEPFSRELLYIVRISMPVSSNEKSSAFDC